MVMVMDMDIARPSGKGEEGKVVPVDEGRIVRNRLGFN